MEFQNIDIKIICEIKALDLFGQLVENPMTNSFIPILPASFVKMDEGSGIVMSVPAHAPFDMQALKEIKLKNNKEYLLFRTNKAYSHN